MLNKVDLYYFSPTGGTWKTASILAKAMAEAAAFYDLGSRKPLADQAESEVAVIAIPVFGGRVPGVAAEKLAQLKGNGRKAVTLAVYGTRAYEDALIELNDLASAAGFQVLASGAFVAQHSVIPEVGVGRPDAQDELELKAFAAKILDKLESGKDTSIQVPGNRPYKEASSLPVTPMCLEGCCLCGKCVAVCPSEAITIAGGKLMTDADQCSLCMACVKACPAGARILPPPLVAAMDEKLSPFKGIRRENERFV